MLFLIDCYWMLDAFMEYISTDKLAHIFLEDNIQISSNESMYEKPERLENNALHK